MNKYIGIFIFAVGIISMISASIFLFVQSTYHNNHLVIYVAGKYANNGTELQQQQIRTNVDNAILAGQQILLKCNYPIVPHMFYFFNVNATSQFWYAIDDLALAKSDAIVVISISKGVEGEIQYAKDHDIPIYYGIEQVPDTCDKK